MTSTKQFSYTLFDSSMIDFKYSESELIETKRIYQSHCNHLCDTENQKGLWKVLTFQRINRIPLFSSIIDSFMRDRLDWYYKTNETLSTTKWVKEYKTILNLSQHLSQTKGSLIRDDSSDLLKGCVDIFGKRYSTFLSLNDIDEKYDDSLEEFTSWIIATTSFIDSLIINNNIAPPFQVTLYILNMHIR